MKKSWNIWLFLTVVVLLPVSVYGVVNWYERKLQQLPVIGGKDHTIANFQFTNQYNKLYSNTNWNNKIVVADFFFTHCPSICPKMTKSLKTVQKAFENVADIEFNSFTVDPESDSAARLKEYATKFDIKGNWQLLTGNKTDLYRLARKSFMIVATDGDGGPQDFIHSDKLVLIDKQKHIRGYYDGTNETEVKQLIIDIKKLKNEN
jgi:protein SCO1